jgi:hypothetical protein
MECRAAFFSGMLTFTVTLVLMLTDTLDLMGLSLESEIVRTANHANALVIQWNNQAQPYPVEQVVYFIKIGFSALVAMIAGGMTIPAVRFSQTFATLIFGAKFERAPLKMRALLWIDYIAPLVAFAVLTPFGIPGVITKTLISFLPANVASSPVLVKAADFLSTPEFDSYLLGAQIFVIVALVLLRLSLLRQHLQCFMDAAVKTISIELAVPNADREGIQVTYHGSVSIVHLLTLLHYNLHDFNSLLYLTTITRTPACLLLHYTQLT